eukprot:2753930-Prymnesium_polylepis.1
MLGRLPCVMPQDALRAASHAVGLAATGLGGCRPGIVSVAVRVCDRSTSTTMRCAQSGTSARPSPPPIQYVRDCSSHPKHAMRCASSSQTLRCQRAQ